MLDWNYERRHWAPQQSYITGDVLVSLIECGWQILDVQTTLNGRAKLHLCTMESEGESLTLRVLDGPAVQNVFAEMDRAAALTATAYAHPSYLLPA